MIRKLILFAAFILSLAYASAQSVGEWKFFTLFTEVDNIIDTPENVYYTSENRLFSYDKNNNETYVFTTQNKLNDSNVSLIQYNPEGKYLFVAYDNSNIDLIYDNGRVVNMSDIKDATLTYNKEILSVTFANNRIYLGTNFGIVIFDDKKHEVVESGIYGVPINYVYPMGNFLVIYRYESSVRGLYCAPLSGHHNTLNKFSKINNFTATWIVPVGDYALSYCHPVDGNVLARATFTEKNNTLEFVHNSVLSEKKVVPNKMMVTDNGKYAISDNEIIYVNNEGLIDHVISIPDALKKQKLATWDGGKTVWGADLNGVAYYDISDGKSTVLIDKFSPEGIVTKEVYYMHFDKTGDLWLGNNGASLFKPSVGGNKPEFVQRTTRIHNGHPQDASLFVASAKDGTTQKWQTNNNSTRMYGGCENFAIDPENPNRYFQANSFEGLYVIEDNKELGRFDWENSPLTGYGYKGIKEVAFDPEGNLWVGFWSGSVSVSPYYILPRKVLNSKDIKDIVYSDWVPSAHLGNDVGFYDMGITFCTKSPIAFTYRRNSDGFGVTRTNGTWGDPRDDTYFEITKTVDQDGKEWGSMIYPLCGIEDQRGRVWLGTTSGLIEITDPASLNENSRINRLKVPRNDGTNYADYLCENDMIYSMAVDNSNRKWIATDASGVFLVSENGDKIIEHFTTENSPLPSNQVVSVACDPNSNTVYFGLLTGLVAYSSTSSPSAEDYSEVYAYPNPVRPDFTGYITITGLMENSVVKITDAQGHVVHQTRSEGGMATWDGLDGNHNHVKSGVYYVFASQDAQGGSESAVTKILIVR